jgi:hypothetical protein
MVEALQMVGYHVTQSDIEPDIAGGGGGVDFLTTSALPLGCTGIVTNPPFGERGVLALRFLEHALELTKPANGFVAMLLRVDYDSAKTRTHLFRDCPAFAKKVNLLDRIVWFADLPPGVERAAPKENHSWYVWDHRHVGAPTIAYASKASGMYRLEKTA